MPKPCNYEEIRERLIYLLTQCGSLLDLVHQGFELKFINAQQEQNHRDNLLKRIADKSSKILITGDLNSGKSTFINTLLRRQIVPDDQEPCTALFVEVVDVAENDGNEQVHATDEPQKYSRLDPSTFTTIPLEKLRYHVENSSHQFQLLKVYCKDYRSLNSKMGGSLAAKVWENNVPDVAQKWQDVDKALPNLSPDSLLHNGIVDISLIDSPGLNIDTIKTTALFSKQQEIDVIVFVVNAENHFTQSAKDFLVMAAKEKAYVFMVINRCDAIARKERNRENILEQIKSISKQTYDNSHNLVHFVSAKAAFQYFVNGVIPDEPHWITDFDKLEKCLREFILHKRVQSKLAPAFFYVKNHLNLLQQEIERNQKDAKDNSKTMQKALGETKTYFFKLKEAKREQFSSLDTLINDFEEEITISVKRALESFMLEFELFTESVEYNGIFHIWDYYQQLRSMVCRLASLRIDGCIREVKERVQEQILSLQKNTNNAISPNILPDPFLEESSFRLSLLDEYPKSLLHDIPSTSLFEGSDKFEVIKDFSPSLLIGWVSYMGYQSLSTGLMFKHRSPSFLRIGKMFFAGCAILGCGMLMFRLADLKKWSQAKVVERMTHYFENARFVEANAKSIALTARRITQSAMYCLQREFQKILDTSESKFFTETKLLETSIQKCESLTNYQTRLVSLQRELDLIPID